MSGFIPLGKHTSALCAITYDVVFNKVVREIPGSLYATDQLAADDGSGEVSPPSHSLDINQPAEGRYRLRIYPNQKQTKFDMRINLFRRDNSSAPTVEFSGTVAAKSAEDYEFDLSTAPGAKVLVERSK